MLDPQYFTTLMALMACYGDSFTFYFLSHILFRLSSFIAARFSCEILDSLQTNMLKTRLFSAVCGCFFNVFAAVLKTGGRLLRPQPEDRNAVLTRDNTSTRIPIVTVTVTVTLRLTVSQSVRLGVEPTLGLVWKFLSCLLGAPSLTRGRVCHLSV
jgi:hypothetical protein